MSKTYLDGDFEPMNLNEYNVQPEDSSVIGTRGINSNIQTSVNTPQPSVCCCERCQHVQVCRLTDSYRVMYEGVINQQMNPEVADAFTVTISCKHFSIMQLTRR